VRTAAVQVVRVVERTDAAAVRGIRHADVRRDSVRARIRAEVGVERPVLLHDHDDVLDLVDAGRRRRLPLHDRALAARGRASARAERPCGDECGGDDELKRGELSAGDHRRI